MLPECYIYVYDTVRDENRWVNKSYVERYPQIYRPTIFHGKRLTAEIQPRGIL